MFSLQSYFEKVFVIHMEKDKDREQHIQEQFQKIATTYEFRRGVIPTKEERIKYASPICKRTCSSSMLGIYLAHRYIWEEMVQKNISQAVIFEDDVTFTENVSSVFPKAFQELPLNWDMLYLGCITCSDTVSPWIRGTMKLKGLHSYDLKPYSTHLRTPSIVIGMEAYALSLEGAKKLLQLFPYASDHVDLMISQKLEKINVFSVYPSVAYQHPSGFQNSNNTTKTPILANKIASLVDVVTLSHTQISMAYVLSIPIFQLHHEIVWNGWCILFICFGFISSVSYRSLSIYLLLELALQKGSNYKQYILYLFCLFLGRWITQMV